MTTTNIELLITKANEDAARKRKEKYRKRYQANKNAIRARDKEHYKANKDAICAKKKEHYEANKDTICAKMKVHYEANKDAISAKNKEYKEVNKDATRVKKSEYTKSHRDEINAYSTQYRKANKMKLQEKRKKRQKTENNSNYQSNYHQTNKSSSSQNHDFSSDFYTIDENSTPQQIRDALLQHLTPSGRKGVEKKIKNVKEKFNLGTTVGDRNNPDNPDFQKANICVICDELIIGIWRKSIGSQRMT